MFPRPYLGRLHVRGKWGRRDKNARARESVAFCDWCVPYQPIRKHFHLEFVMLMVDNAYSGDKFGTSRWMQGMCRSPGTSASAPGCSREHRLVTTWFAHSGAGLSGSKNGTVVENCHFVVRGVAEDDHVLMLRKTDGESAAALHRANPSFANCNKFCRTGQHARTGGKIFNK